MRTIPSPFDILRVLPRVGLHLFLPAVVVGAIGGSLLDLVMAHEGYPLAMVGVVLGPVGFALAINALERADAAHVDEMMALAEAYRREETEKRRRVATARGELIQFEDQRARRRSR